MNWNWKQYRKEKTLFRSYYCANCKQIKPCGTLTKYTDWESYCCSCYFQSKQEESQEYSDYQQVYQRKSKEKKEHIKQLQLLKSYSGCRDCGSLEVDAYNLYEKNKLVCWTCLIKKEGSATGAISFLERGKWYKKRWGINLTEWLENYGSLPVNASCARKWLKDKEHLKSCNCLKREVKDLVNLFANSLKEYQEKLKECKCEVSNKPRTPYYDSANYGYTYCEKCEVEIKGAGKMGVIKNRNNPSFWGLEVEKKVLCLKCLGELVEKMPKRKRYLLAEYLKREYS